VRLSFCRNNCISVTDCIAHWLLDKDVFVILQGEENVFKVELGNIQDKDDVDKARRTQLVRICRSQWNAVPDQVCAVRERLRRYIAKICDFEAFGQSV
jgi:hypothetical protein